MSLYPMIVPRKKFHDKRLATTVSRKKLQYKSFTTKCHDKSFMIKGRQNAHVADDESQ